MQPKRVILVRHGETSWNQESRFMGHSDLGLNEKGWIQARAAAELLLEQDIERIFCSDLLRALETGHEIASSHNLAVHRVVSLREMYFGEWEGLTFTEIEKRYPELSSAWLNDPARVKIPAGETAEQVKDRVMEAWEYIKKVSGAKAIVIVTHGGPLRLLLCHLTGIDLSQQWEFNVAPGEVIVLDKYADNYFIQGSQCQSTHL